MVDYAAEAASHGAVYLEAIFSPAERVRRGVAWDDIFAGYCDGAEEARELHGVEIRLTPDIVRGFPLDEAEPVVRYSARYADRGVVGVGLGGLEAQYPPEPYAPVFELAKAEGLGSVPHAGEVAGPGFDPRRARRAAERTGSGTASARSRTQSSSPSSRERSIVLDVSPVSNVRTGAVALAGRASSAEARRRRRALLDLDRRSRHVRHRPDAATTTRQRSLGVDPRSAYEAGVEGALCDEATRERLREVGQRASTGPNSPKPS